MNVPDKYNGNMLRCQVVHLMVVNADIILQKCNTKLRVIYGLIDPKVANTPGSLAFEDYLSYMLLNDSWGDQVVSEVILMLWQMRLTILNVFKSLR